MSALIETTCPDCGAPVHVLRLDDGTTITQCAAPRRTPIQVGETCSICTVRPVHSEVCPGPVEED